MGVFGRSLHVPAPGALHCRRHQAAFALLLAAGLLAVSVAVVVSGRAANRATQKLPDASATVRSILAEQRRQAATLAALEASLGRMGAAMAALGSRPDDGKQPRRDIGEGPGRVDGPDGPAALRAQLAELEERSREALAAANKRIDWLETLVYSQDVTGATAPAAAHRHGPRATARSPLGWYVVHAEPGVAVISGAKGTLDVTPGLVVPQLGRVSAIRRDGDYWIVVTESGIIRER